jgi:hypothetical protein
VITRRCVAFTIDVLLLAAWLTPGHRIGDWLAATYVVRQRRRPARARADPHPAGLLNTDSG